MQVTTASDLILHITKPGELLPWIGPALRGLVAGRLKAMVCQQPRTERDTRWKHCTGCQHAARCAYARLYEPEAIGNEHGGLSRSPARPVVLAPYFPTPEYVDVGDVIPLRLLLVGQVESLALDDMLTAVADVGRKPGIGPDEVTFELEPVPVQQLRLQPGHLPVAVDAVSDVVPRLGIGLVSPLFISHRPMTPRGEARGARKTIYCPSLIELFRASARVLDQLFRQQGNEAIDADLPDLEQAAECVELLDHCYEPFRQTKWSNRNKQRYELDGVVGGGVYRDVPWALVPWLLWGGRLHTAGHRVAGAGGWRLVMD